MVSIQPAGAFFPELAVGQVALVFALFVFQRGDLRQRGGAAVEELLEHNERGHEQQRGDAGVEQLFFTLGEGEGHSGGEMTEIQNDAVKAACPGRGRWRWCL
jgi:hypothetical protein